tara:strand:- start:217 stop:399 length:183 start_codon:yes stop_codon:yes gene_type:complete
VGSIAREKQNILKYFLSSGKLVFYQKLTFAARAPVFLRNQAENDDFSRFFAFFAQIIEKR